MTKTKSGLGVGKRDTKFAGYKIPLFFEERRVREGNSITPNPTATSVLIASANWRKLGSFSDAFAHRPRFSFLFFSRRVGFGLKQTDSARRDTCLHLLLLLLLPRYDFSIPLRPPMPPDAPINTGRPGKTCPFLSPFHNISPCCRIPLQKVPSSLTT